MKAQEVTANDIQNVVGYMNEFKQGKENGKDVRVNDLLEKYDAPKVINSAMKELKYIDIEGIGRSTKYKFRVGKFEPIHARSVLSKIHEIHHKQYEKSQNRGLRKRLMEDEKEKRLIKIVRKKNFFF